MVALSWSSSASGDEPPRPADGIAGTRPAVTVCRRRSSAALKLSAHGQCSGKCKSQRRPECVRRPGTLR
jgi:hypothetical protein